MYNRNCYSLYISMIYVSKVFSTISDLIIREKLNQCNVELAFLVGPVSAMLIFYV